MSLKIAVYGICKNEEQFVKRFMESIKHEADMVIITDTGSTDNTVQLLRDEGAIVHEITMKPWQFDTPRNVSLSFVPEDIDVCVCIDLDEVLTPGWRAAVEKAWLPGTTRLRYQYVWSTLPDGRPGITFWYDKIVSRKGYRWVKPVHEILKYYNGEEVQVYAPVDSFKLFHYPDASKSRGSYLPLLELGCKDEPDDDRNSHYLGREYMYYRMWNESIVELKRHLALPSANWNVERCASMRFISRSYLALDNKQESEVWGLKACAEAPNEREPWLDLGKVYYKYQNWSGLYFTMKQLLNIESKPTSYICETDAWNGIPYDMASIAAYYMGMFKEAVELSKIAVSLEPDDDRIKNNLLLCEAKL